MNSINRPAASAGRDVSLEALRGLAIVLVVTLHATAGPAQGASSNGGGNYLLYQYFADSFDNIRMPLFTVLAGFVYALRPFGQGARFVLFLRAKASRLLIPMATAVSVTLALAHFAGGELALPLGRLHRAYLFNFTHFWYLQALFLVFLLVAALDRRAALNHVQGFLGVLAVAALAKYPLPEIAFFSFSGAVYLLPYFVLGVGLYRFQALIEQRWVFSVMTLLAAGAMGLQQAALAGLCTIDLSKGGALGTVLGLSSGYVLVQLRRPLPWLAVLGAYSYTIYLYHHIGISVAQRLVGNLGLASYDVLYAAKCAFGILTGLGVQLVAQRFPWLRWLVLGQAQAQRRPRVGPGMDAGMKDGTERLERFLLTR